MANSQVINEVGNRVLDGHYGSSQTDIAVAILAGSAPHPRVVFHRVPDTTVWLFWLNAQLYGFVEMCAHSARCTAIMFERKPIKREFCKEKTSGGPRISLQSLCRSREPIYMGPLFKSGAFFC